MAGNSETHILLLGDGGVGKTSLLRRIIGDNFEKKYLPTMGMDVFYYENFIFYDTAGQERFSTLNIQKVDGCLVLFSIDSRNSARSIDFWQSKLKMISDKAMVLFVGTKQDLELDHRKVHVNDSIEISCRNGYGIDILIDALNFL